MSNEKILKQKIEKYLIAPVFISLFLIAMCISFYFIDRKCAIIATAVVSVVIIVELIAFFITRTGIMPALVRFALEQGQIQKELLKELAIPYALLDVDGKILWANNEFVNRIADGAHKRIRKSIETFFPSIDSEVLKAEEPVYLDILFNECQYNALVNKINFNSIFQGEQ